MTDKPETVADVLADIDLIIEQDHGLTPPARSLKEHLISFRDRIDRAMSASAVPVARVAEVHLTRYTIEWIGGPLPEGALLYGYPPSVCWQHRPGSPCPWPASCRSNGCSAVERELYPEDAVPPAVPVTESNCAERIALMLMDCADMLGMFPCAVIDSRAWEHLLVYAPKPAVPVESLGRDAPPYGAPFTTDVRNCCESPETCPEPCAPPPASVPDTLRSLYAAAAKGFHVSESCGSDKKYHYVSKFDSLDDLLAYHTAWIAAMVSVRDAVPTAPEESP